MAGNPAKKTPVQSFIKGIFAATFLSAVFLSIGSFLLAVIILLLGPVASLTLARQSYRGSCPYCGNDVCGHAPVFQCHLCKNKISVRDNSFHRTV
jgi:multisubunit Na+/H+ antiporter MnhG subunit